ncbi:hypothetical protein CC1G_06128 [Coprinopsis cinerea okayama7|uniref:F-box domain-containing protein n=1 Tax=Coprinopsis cinerea (strain Okayama-7 / 130 / ATCC MYA-4618 / FGSC 9003) TaxID=240176 RepID=A8PA96_COPC7|nr:hypothetical protein CC1G_06128 [Coprinopsis cinerea okayama7\|eukprot:XP_001839938.2 hypothetical protein CC1G_06128 [Coprinopsis cinerea okayama7\
MDLGPPGFTGLPEELIIAVMQYLELQDVLYLRECCRMLCNLSKERSVWVALLNRYYETSFHQPFLLSKPLANCTALDINKRIMRRWTGLDKQESPSSRPDVFTVGTPLHGRCTHMLFLPFGHFFVFHDEDGAARGLASKSYVHPPAPHTFPVPSQIYRASIEDRLFPRAFNMAVIHQHYD